MRTVFDCWYVSIKGTIKTDFSEEKIGKLGDG